MIKIKIPFFIINFVFLVAGIGVLGLGIYYHFSGNPMDMLLQKSYSGIKFMSQDPFKLKTLDPISYLMMACGALVFFISFIGYCGAVKDIRCLLVFYGIILTVGFIVQVTLVVLYYCYRNELTSILSENLKTHYTTYETNDNPNGNFTYFVNYIMVDNECCGISGYEDFKNVYDAKKDNNQTIPESCCVFKDKKDALDVIQEAFSEKSIRSMKQELLKLVHDQTCTSEYNVINSHAEKGCLKIILEIFELPLIIAIVLVGTLEICGIVFSVFIFRAAWYDYVP